MHVYTKIHTHSGVSSISFRGGGGVQNDFRKEGANCKATRLLGEFGGMLAEKKIKMVQFGAFWRVFC